MKSITDALGLDPSADEPAILAAIEALKSAGASLQQQLAEALAARTGIPKGISAAEVKEKMAIGLTKEQAIEVLTRQAEEDKASEETEQPEKKKKGK